jgi:hypothetical protein
LADKKENSVLMRRLGEAAALAAVVFVFWTLDTLAKRNARLVNGYGLDDFRLIAEQVTSGLTVWLLIPAVAWWLTRFPISPGQVGSKIIGHLLGSALFATAHYFIMSGMRSSTHGSAGPGNSRISGSATCWSSTRRTSRFTSASLPS